MTTHWLRDKPVQQLASQGMNYQLFKVQGKCRFDIRSNDAINNQYRLTVSLRHRQLDRHSMIYVVDYTGMQDFQAGEPRRPLFGPDSSWSLNAEQYHQQILLDPVRGDPWFLLRGAVIGLYLYQSGNMDSLEGQGLTQPAVVRFLGVRNRGMVESAAYSIKFCMADMARQSELVDRFWQQAWQAMTRAGIRFGPLTQPELALFPATANALGSCMEYPCKTSEKGPI